MQALTTYEIMDMVGGNYYMQDFIDNQQVMTISINFALSVREDAGKPTREALEILLGTETERVIYSVICRHLDKKARQVAQAAKYANVKPHVSNTVEIGSILYSSWGYDQTNVDFYCVVELRGSMAILLPLSGACEASEGLSDMAGYSSAGTIIDFEAEPMRKKVQIGGSGQYCKISSCQYARMYDGGKKYTSWYA